MFEVPSADSFIMNYLKKGYKTDKIFRFIESARHLLFFSSQIIKIICKKYNFSIYFIETNGLDIQTILNDKENSNIKTILNMQDLLNESMLADHYRVFLKKN